MPQWLDNYAAERDQLLNAITDFLERDERFVAAWLGGSFGRGEADALSDLDLFVGVDDRYSDAICRRQRQVAEGTTDERLALVSQFGRPAIIHENHNNAPEGASFTVVVYADTAVPVDWTLVPQAKAQRQPESLLLFEKAAIPTSRPNPPDEDIEERTHRLSERRAFFWMMTVPTTKYALRGDAVYFHIMLDMLHRTVADVERLLRGERWEYQRGSTADLAVTIPEQVAAVRKLCERMLELEVEMRLFGVSPFSSPMGTLDKLFGLTNESSVT